LPTPTIRAQRTYRLGSGRRHQRISALKSRPWRNAQIDAQSADPRRAAEPIFALRIVFSFSIAGFFRPSEGRKNAPFHKNYVISNGYYCMP
jgi:hypothetical protein